MQKARTYQCPNCGGVMEFDPITGRVRCSFCESEFDEGEVAAEIPLGDVPSAQGETSHAKTVEDFLERAPWEVTADGTVNAVVYSCPSCAAEVAADQSVVSTTCPYCGNNMLVSGTASKENVPQWVLPFSVSKEQAEQRMRQHFEHKWYLSRAFDASLEHMQGMYIPYHLYNLRVWGHADYIGYETETRTDSEGNSHTEHYYYAIKRKGHAAFARIPVDGSSKMPDGHMDAISPFDFGKLRDFQASYAAGYLMEVADEDAQTCLPRAEGRARRSFEDDLKADAARERGVDGIEEVTRNETQVAVEGIESAVLPVWMMHCAWEGKQMLFAVNGETGKCVGDLPVEGKRRAATVVVTALVFAVLAFIVSMLVINDDDSSFGFIVGAVIVVVLGTFFVDQQFMSQMRTAVEATNASMSYDSQGLVVTDRWRSPRRTGSKGKARRWLDGV